MTFGNIITEFPDHKKCYFRNQNDVFVLIVSQTVMYSCEIFTNFGGHFVFDQEKDKRELGMGQIWNRHIRIA